MLFPNKFRMFVKPLQISRLVKISINCLLMKIFADKCTNFRWGSIRLYIAYGPGTLMTELEGTFNNDWELVGVFSKLCY